MYLPVLLDRLVILVENVRKHEFEKIAQQIVDYELYGKIPEKVYRIGTTTKEYHHNFLVKGLNNEGSVFISWKHNSKREQDQHDMRIEFNPAKADQEWHKLLFGFLNDRIKRKKKYLTMMDIACDLKQKMETIFSLSIHSRLENRYKGTRYFGERSHHGYLKIYDKKKERKDKAGIEIEGDLTRIEFTWKGKVPLEEFDHIRIGFDKLYQIKILDDPDGIIDIETQCVIFAIIHGHVEIKDFSRRKKEKIKKALDSLQDVDIEQLYNENRETIKQTIHQYISMDDPSVIPATDDQVS